MVVPVPRRRSMGGDRPLGGTSHPPSWWARAAVAGFPRRRSIGTYRLVPHAPWAATADGGGLPFPSARGPGLVGAAVHRHVPPHEQDHPSPHLSPQLVGLRRRGQPFPVGAP